MFFCNPSLRSLRNVYTVQPIISNVLVQTRYRPTGKAHPLLHVLVKSSFTLFQHIFLDSQGYTSHTLAVHHYNECLCGSRRNPLQHIHNPHFHPNNLHSHTYNNNPHSPKRQYTVCRLLHLMEGEIS